MQKSNYTDPTVQDRGFYKHIHHVTVDMGIYPDGGRLVESYKVVLRENGASAGAGGGKPRNIELYRKALGPGQDLATSAWTRIGLWQEGVDYDDSSASGSVAVDLVTGDVHVLLVFGKLINGALRFQDWEQTIKRATFAPAIVRPSVAQGPQGVPGPKGDKGDIGPQGPKGDPGSGGAALSGADRKALDWVKGWLGSLLG